MTGISGFKTPDFPTLQTNPIADRQGVCADVRTFDLSVPGTIPETDNLSPSEVYDLFSGYVESFGSEEAKQALASGEKIELLVHAEDQPDMLWKVELDASAQTGRVLYVTGNETVSRGGAGSNDPSLLVDQRWNAMQWIDPTEGLEV